MNQDAINQLNADYVKAGSWLNSLAESETPVCYLIMLHDAIEEMKARVAKLRDVELAKERT